MKVKFWTSRLGALALGLALLSAACQSIVTPQVGTSTSTPEASLPGVWDWGKAILYFAEDGTYAMAQSPYDIPLGETLDSGVWSLAGDALTMESDPDSLLCEGATAVYRIQRLDDEAAEFVQESDTCEIRVGANDSEDGGPVPPLARIDVTISDELGVMDVTVGDRQLSVRCEGAGSPTVLLESGLFDPWTVWWKVQPHVAEFTRVCSYSRAELEEGEALTGRQIADDLHGLVTNAGIEGPYVLVGHSIGGLLVRQYADQYPDQVVGMVLVDASHEEQRERYAGVMPEDFYQEMLEFEAENPDGIDFAETAAEAKAVGDLGDLPLVVISAHEPADPEIPAEVYEAMDDLWLEMQAELASLSSEGSQVMAEESGHNIHLDQPQLVIDAIQQVTEASLAQSQ